MKKRGTTLSRSSRHNSNKRGKTSSKSKLSKNKSVKAKSVKVKIKKPSVHKKSVSKLNKVTKHKKSKSKQLSSKSKQLSSKSKHIKSKSVFKSVKHKLVKPKHVKHKPVKPKSVKTKHHKHIEHHRPKKPWYVKSIRKLLRKEERELKHVEHEVEEEFFAPSPIHKGKYKIPLGIRMLIGYLGFLAALYVVSFWQGITFPTTILFGSVITGTRALIINVFLVLMLFIMIYGFVKRKAYTFDLSIAWFGFSLLNSLISLLLLESKEYLIFKSMLYISLITLVLVSGVIIWYILHERKYFYSKYFKERGVQHRDKVFVYTLISFWIIVILIGSTLGIAFYERSTGLVDKTISEINELEYFTQDFCDSKEGEERDICILVLLTYRNVKQNEPAFALKPYCEEIGSEFYKFTCHKVLTKSYLHSNEG
ncbi:hypothetical protein HOK51_11325 [Candidatus Woesearchaeota archaeon]|jgi:hypothetical protein|nr:hypothetical protein [Candidatus Woesearchaeota archaeon]MBT6520413.1 hypothetical protein [Candidatus Woesearchaeota archaeon]MBT7367127.1 hypothetical protein [Candidatus Woesearchaeota archaeon]